MSLLKKVTNVFASCWLLYCLFNAFSFVCSGYDIQMFVEIYFKTAFAKLNPREIFRMPEFAKLNPREIFEKTRFAKLNPREIRFF